MRRVNEAAVYRALARAALLAGVSVATVLTPIVRSEAQQAAGLAPAAESGRQSAPPSSKPSSKPIVPAVDNEKLKSLDEKPADAPPVAPRKLDGAELKRLIALVDTGSTDERNEATKTLAEAEPKSLEPAVADLARIVDQDRDQSRRHAIFLLGVVGPGAKPALPALKKMLRHEDFHTQYWTCRTLAKMGDAALEAVPDLTDQLRAQTASVRRNAALAIGQLGPKCGEQVVSPLTNCLKDRQQMVRSDAATALGKLGAVAMPAVPALREAARDPNRAIRSQSALAVWRLTKQTDDVLEPLLAELASLDAPWDAADALNEVGPAAAPLVPKVRALLKSPDAETRAYAAQVLGGIGPEARVALAELKKIAANDDEDEDALEAARDAVKKLETVK